MKPTVFIHTNEKQIVGAIVSAYSLKRNSPNADKFDVRVLEVKDFPFLRARHGQKFLRGGVERVWDMEDLQSFTPLRFAPPELMGYKAAPRSSIPTSSPPAMSGSCCRGTCRARR